MSKRKLKLATLSLEENDFWENIFAYYVEEGYDDDEADKLAWEEMQEEFPRLLKYDGIK